MRFTADPFIIFTSAVIMSTVKVQAFLQNANTMNPFHTTPDLQLSSLPTTEPSTQTNNNQDFVPSQKVDPSIFDPPKDWSEDFGLKVNEEELLLTNEYTDSSNGTHLMEDDYLNNSTDDDTTNNMIAEPSNIYYHFDNDHTYNKVLGSSEPMIGNPSYESQARSYESLPDNYFSGQPDYISESTGGSSYLAYNPSQGEQYSTVDSLPASPIYLSSSGQGTAPGMTSDEYSYTFDPNTWSADTYNKNKIIHNNPSTGYTKIHENQNSGMTKNKYTQSPQMKSYSKKSTNPWTNTKQVTNMGLGKPKSMPKYSNSQQSSRGRSIKSSQFNPSQSIIQLDELTDQVYEDKINENEVYNTNTVHGSEAYNVKNVHGNEMFVEQSPGAGVIYSDGEYSEFGQQDLFQGGQWLMNEAELDAFNLNLQQQENEFVYPGDGLDYEDGLIDYTDEHLVDGILPGESYGELVDGILPGQSYDPKDYMEMIKLNGGQVPSNLVFVNPAKNENSYQSQNNNNKFGFSGTDPKIAEPGAYTIANYAELPSGVNVAGGKTNYAKKPVVQPNYGTVEEKQLYPGMALAELEETVVNNINMKSAKQNAIIAPNTFFKGSEKTKEGGAEHTHHYHHSHKHDHDSNHTHEHGHAHDHKSSHSHAHNHEHKATADHTHGHEHGHKHAHEHKNVHEHTAAHDHTHKHDNSHAHEHQHAHKNGHKHLHQHKGEHTHDHAHNGEHKHRHIHEHHHHHHHKHTHASEHKHGHDHVHSHKGHY